MTDFPAIKPCPFCGGTAVVEECDSGIKSSRFSVGCSEEGDGGDLCMGYQSLTTFNTRREAVEAWNKRSDAR